MAEAAGGVADRAGIGDRRHVAVADSIGAIVQRRKDVAAAIDNQAIGKAIALGQGRGLREVAGQRHRTSIGDRRHVAVANSIAAIVQRRRTDGAALGDADVVAERVALIRLRRLAEAAGGVADRAGIGDRRHVAVADSIGAIAQHRIDGAAVVNDQAIGKAIALGQGRGLREGAGQRHRTSIGDRRHVAVADSIGVIAQRRRTDGAALGDADAVAERVALIRLRRLAEAAGGVADRAGIGDRRHVAVADSIGAIVQRRKDVAAAIDNQAIGEAIALGQGRGLREGAGQRHRTSIGDRRHVAGANSIAAIAQRRVDGAALGDVDAVAERVALIRLRRLGEAAGAGRRQGRNW